VMRSDTSARADASPAAVRIPTPVAMARGFARRCPRCGQGKLFTRWLTMPERCPGCGLAFERGDGFWLGAMAVNLGVTEAIFGLFVVGGILLTWPGVPWVALTVGGVLLNAVVPVVFYPFSKTIVLAFDLLRHQAEIVNAPELERTACRPPGHSKRGS
jgi:uncharacterized protein (DUF983 family)